MVKLMQSTTVTAPLQFNLFACVTWDGRCTRCYSKVLTAGCPNADCEASRMGIQVFVIPVQLIAVEPLR